MIDLEKNKKRAKEEMKKYTIIDDYEKRQENFKNLVSEKEGDPKYSELIREYWDVEAKIKQYALRQDNTTQVGTDDEAFQKSFHDIRPLSSRSFEIQMQILNLYYNDIMREEN